MIHWLCSQARLALLLTLIAATQSLASEVAVFGFVQKNCVSCHNAKVTSGDVNLAGSKDPKTFDENREIWEKVVSKLKTNEMPPPGLPRPPAAEVATVTKWLHGEFARQDRAVRPDAGRVTARRLNRAEYNNTIRDLLGVDIRPADNFPQDESAFGFDNISDALNLSPVLLEKYVDAAERAVRTAIFGPEKLKPSMTHYPSPVRIPKLPQNLMEYDETGLHTQHAAHVKHRFPVDAEYTFRVVLNGHRPDQSEPVKAAFWIDGRRLDQVFEVDGSDLEGRVLEWRSKVAAGEHLLSMSYLRNYHGLPPKYKGPEPSKLDQTPLLSNNARGKLTEKDIEILRKFGTKVKTDRIEVRVDNRTESIDVGGPFNQSTGPSQASLRRIFVCGHAVGRHAVACARPIVKSFATRAFRRPATAAEVNEFLKYVTLVRKNGDSFEEGIATALQAILVSHKFLFRMEQDRSAATRRGLVPISTETHASVPVNDYELASRMSYFLWSSMPDAELLRLAGQRQLRRRAVLEAQVRRMLRDPKANALVENFAGQWLQFKNIDVMRPDGEKFPGFDESLRHSMRRETELFIENIVRNNGSVLEFLDADCTFLDERLARFYGIPGITGPEFRRVDVSRTPRGGGILAHASVLTVSSYSTRTSPVLRGKWILENLLNAPPPPPPPSVPALDDTKIGQSGTLRQQMEEHRKNPACASCHSRMDPLGFGLENFDAIGAWRTVDGKFPVDASGSLPGGRSFNGPVELKTLLANQDREAFVRGLTEKLLTYALGRGLERFDKPVVSSIANRLPSRDYRFSELVLEIVNSLPFQQRRAREDKVLTARTGDISR
jgi:hypothetical protein